jgi:hypothetical protein
MKWVVALWNTNLPDRNDPLPIPIGAFDWLRQHTESGPQNLFGAPGVSPLLKEGDHLLGSASIACARCKRGRTFVLSIVWGESGWFSEVVGETSGDVLIPRNFLKETREGYFRQLEVLAPKKSRIPIRDR